MVAVVRRIWVHPSLSLCVCVHASGSLDVIDRLSVRYLGRCILIISICVCAGLINDQHPADRSGSNTKIQGRPSSSSSSLPSLLRSSSGKTRNRWRVNWLLCTISYYILGHFRSSLIDRTWDHDKRIVASSRLYGTEPVSRTPTLPLSTGVTYTFCLSIYAAFHSSLVMDHQHPHCTLAWFDQ